MDLHRRAAIAAAAATLALPAEALRAQPAIRLPGDLRRGERATVTAIRTAQPVVALTFDDGPHARLTPRLLDMLAARRVRATFYLIGNRVRAHAALVRRIVAEGHEIGNHSWSHPFMDRFSDAATLRQIDATTHAVFEVTGRAPVTFRPPYGAFTRRQRAMLHGARSLPTVLWSVDPQDWRRPGASVVARRIVAGARPGAIVLSHDIHPGTVRAMPATLEALIARGYRFATISEMLGWPRWDSRSLRLVARG
jgi:peptidoglycan/xylan/chitin deacetylase (PgdA/CDA1 family)